MTSGTLIGSARATSAHESQVGESWPAENLSRPAGELPAVVAGWSLTRVAAGWWLSDAARGVPAPVRALVPEPGRPSLVIDAQGPDRRTDRLLHELSPVLSSADLAAVRLVLSSSGRYARTSSCAPGIDLIAADGPVVITPHGYALVRPAGPVTDAAAPQWYRRLSSGDCEAVGALAPSPSWERGLADVLTAGPAHDLWLRRVPAGLALAGPDQGAWLASAAQQVWPDPERPTIVIDGTLRPEAVCRHLRGLLSPLVRHAADGIRLHWPRAGAGRTGPALAELAGEIGVDLIVPAADVSACGFGAICRGPSGAAPWLRFGRDKSVDMLGSLYPTPAWESALAEDGLAEPSAGVLVEDVAAGLCVYRPGPSQRGLRATARSILPDPARITIIAGGDADAVQHDVAQVLGGLPAGAAASVRLLLAGPAAHEVTSCAQELADGFDCEIVAPAHRWTATPDGRIRALAAPGAATRPGADAWRTFRPRPAVGEPAPATVEPPTETSQPAAAAPVEAARAEVRPVDAGLAGAALAGAAPAKAGLAEIPPVEAGLAGAVPVEAGLAEVRPVEAGLAGAVPVEAGLAEVRPVEAGLAGAVPVEAALAEAAPDRAEMSSDAVAEPERPVAPPEPGGQVPAASRAVAMLSRDHRSTAAERLAYRESATDFQAHSVSVRQMMTQRPGLRSAAGGEAMEAVATDFTAVLDLLSGDRRVLAAELRARGTAGSPKVACALSGLHRLPSFTGVVFSSASLPAESASGYTVGGVLMEPSFVEASSSQLVALPGGVEYVIWSQTGKRMAALAAWAGRDEIIFAAGTSYRVLLVQEASSGASPLRIFLRELTMAAGVAHPVDDALDEADHRVLERLAPAAALRDGVPAEAQSQAGRPALAPIGLDDRGVSFSERAR
jgi:hypothetical protein